MEEKSMAHSFFIKENSNFSMIFVFFCSTEIPSGLPGSIRLELPTRSRQHQGLCAVQKHKPEPRGFPEI